MAQGGGINIKKIDDALGVGVKELTEKLQNA
jgi:hypothetical protein